MAQDVLLDAGGDPYNSDANPSYVHVQTVGYTGPYNDCTIPASPNYPPVGKDSSGNAVTPSRYRVQLTFTPFSNANLPILLKDVTSGVTLTPTTSAPSLNQYRWSYSVNNTTIYPDVFEFNSGQAGHTLAIDCYAKQSIIHANWFNAPKVSGNVTVDGNLNVDGTLTLASGQILGNLNVVGNLSYKNGNNIINQSIVSLANTITISSLDINNSNKVFELFFGIYNPSSSFDYINIYINGDYTNTNYKTRGSRCLGNILYEWVQDFPGIGYSYANSYNCGHAYIYFMKNKVFIFFNSHVDQSGASYTASIIYNTTISNVTQIDIKTYSGVSLIDVGSTLVLYQRGI